MKIMAATTEGGLDDLVSEVFGRCATFTMVDVEGKEIKGADVVPNQFAGGTGGVGIQVAQMAVKEKVQAVLAGRFGPNATQVLDQAGIDMVPMAGVPVRQAVEKYISGEKISPAGNPAAVPPGPGGGPGRGIGSGRGRDIRCGASHGRGHHGGGMEHGGGPMDGGMGMEGGHRGHCHCRSASFGSPDSSPGQSKGPHIAPASLRMAQERQMLEAEKEALEERLEEIRNRIEESEK